jgi:hypothetical protein
MFNTNTLIRPHILISPFSYRSLDEGYSLVTPEHSTTRVIEMVRAHISRDFQFTWSGRAALELVLLDLGVTPDDIITIVLSIGNYYVSGCVTKTIEKHCRWSMKIEPNSKAILVIHEWGVVHRDLSSLKMYGLPIIEDCAYAFASSTSEYKAGSQGNYAIYSLSKFFPVNLGGIACGLSSQTSCMEKDEVAYLCSMLHSAGSIDSISTKRRNVWSEMKSLFETVGAAPAFALEEGDIPGVFMFHVHEGVEPDAVKARYTEHGIESSVYYGSRNVFVPCHQNLGQGSIRYIFDVYQDLMQHAADFG